MEGYRPSTLPLALLLTILVFVGGVVTGVAGRLACDENVHPGTTRATVCDAVGTNSSLALFALLPPAIMITAIVVGTRRGLLPLAGVLLIVEAVALVVILATAT